jgi:hypothetical protein
MPDDAPAPTPALLAVMAATLNALGDDTPVVLLAQTGRGLELLTNLDDPKEAMALIHDGWHTLADKGYVSDHEIEGGVQ